MATPSKRQKYGESLDIFESIHKGGGVTPTKFSGKNYFDTKVLTAPCRTEPVRVMANSTTRKQLFVEKKESKQPGVLSKLSAVNYIKFFNSNSVSQLNDKNDIQRHPV